MPAAPFRNYAAEGIVGYHVAPGHRQALSRLKGDDVLSVFIKTTEAVIEAQLRPPYVYAAMLIAVIASHLRLPPGRGGKLPVQAHVRPYFHHSGAAQRRLLPLLQLKAVDKVRPAAAYLLCHYGRHTLPQLVPIFVRVAAHRDNVHGQQSFCHVFRKLHKGAQQPQLSNALYFYQQHRSVAGYTVLPQCFRPPGLNGAVLYGYLQQQPCRDPFKELRLPVFRSRLPQQPVSLRLAHGEAIVEPPLKLAAVLQRPLLALGITHDKPQLLSLAGSYRHLAPRPEIRQHRTFGVFCLQHWLHHGLLRCFQPPQRL